MNIEKIRDRDMISIRKRTTWFTEEEWRDECYW